MRTDERGETLIELLVTVVLMAIGLVAIVGGLAVSIHASDVHRRQATAGTAVRDYAEAIENWVAAGNFPACGDGAAYATVPVPAFPSGYTRSVTSSCPGGAGLRRLAVTVSSSDGRATERVVLVVRKPCGPGDPPC